MRELNDLRNDLLLLDNDSLYNKLSLSGYCDSEESEKIYNEFENALDNLQTF
jgi:hypothetical protein